MKDITQEKSPIKQKILLYLDKKGVTPYEFYKITGVTRGILTQTNGISEENLARFLDYAQDINPTWLLTGTGSMLKADRQNAAIHTENTYHNSLPMRPRISFAAQAGVLSEIFNTANYKDLEQLPIISTFPDYDFTIPVEGDSMSPEYLPGDELACTKLGSISEVKWGRAYVLDTARGVVVKKIYDGGDHILCHSVNPDYKDYTIDKSDIYSICAIVGYIRNSIDV